MCSDPACPARVSCVGGVLPSGPSPCGVSLLTCHGLRTPADSGALAMNRALHIAFQHVKTVGIRISYFEAVPALQGTRFPLRPTRFSVYAYPIYCSQVNPLRNGTNTRYGRVASPYPTGTYTPQETPSLARHDNVWGKAARAPTDSANPSSTLMARSRSLAAR